MSQARSADPAPHEPTPRFSVIVASCNTADFIAAAIESVQAQTVSDWELIVVDDASTDTTPAILQRYADTDARIRPVFLDTNSGAARARNKAIERARGRYIAFLDSDDLWYPTKLERQAALFETTAAVLVYSGYQRIDQHGDPLGAAVSVPDRIDYRGLLNRTVIATVTAVYDTHQVGRVLMPLLAKRQDYGLWLALLRRGGVARGVDEPLAALRKRPGSLSSDKLSAIGYTWRVYRELEGFGRIRSAYHFSRYLCHAVFKAAR